MKLEVDDILIFSDDSGIAVIADKSSNYGIVGVRTLSSDFPALRFEGYHHAEVSTLKEISVNISHGIYSTASGRQLLRLQYPKSTAKLEEKGLL